MIKKVLTIAGFDASGGAGLQADLKTFSALGCYGMSVLTALPIQNTNGVSNCYPIPINAISEQLISIFDDIMPDAIKVGMLFNDEIIQIVGNFLQLNAIDIPIIIDPVMVAKSGHHLLVPDAVDNLKHNMLKLATVVTPNISEAEILSNMKIINHEDMISAGRIILNYGTKAVLVKGGHSESDTCNDLLITHDRVEWFNALRINTINTHGTGCTLSAAIAAFLARGFDLSTSVAKAKDYIHNALLHFKDEKIGHGHGPVHHFYNLWQHVY